MSDEGLRNASFKRCHHSAVKTRFASYERYRIMEQQIEMQISVQGFYETRHSMLDLLMARKRSKPPIPAATLPDPYWEQWVSLTPAQRLRRSWRLRLRLRNLKMSHDAKTLPQL